MSGEMRVGGGTRAGNVQQDSTAQGPGSSGLGGPPQLPMGELGIAGMVAMLAAGNASANAKFARDLQKKEEDAQAAAIERQVAALREKAADTRAEGLLSGALTAAGGAVTIASVAATPTVQDGARAGQWNEAAKSYPGGQAAAGAINVRMDQMKVTSEALRASGTTIGQLGTQVSHMTYGAAREGAEADATKAAADAKFHEAAKDEYASLAKEAKGTADKVSQFLQAVLAEKQMTTRGILKMA